jgi:hypothetical protein
LVSARNPEFGSDIAKKKKKLFPVLNGKEYNNNNLGTTGENRK